MNIEEEIKHSDEVHGLTRDTFVDVIRNENFKRGVEIGVQYGQNAEKILDNTGVEKLYGVDPYNTSIYPISPLKGMDEEIYQSALKRMERFGSRYELIRKVANDALLDIDGEIDFVYIDGGKSKINIIDDVSLWYPKIRKNGIIAGNDYDHRSYPWITRFLHKNFTHVNNGPGDLWWIYKKNPTKGRKISVVIPFYNTAHYVKTMIDLLIKDERINDVVIVDDCSEEGQYESLAKIANHPKIKLYKNEKNLGEFKTRILGAERARCRWIIVLDGDNVLLPEYLDAIEAIPYWRDDVIYCPDYGTNNKIDYRKLSGCYLGPGNIKRFLGDYSYLVAMMLGTGNYFLNRGAYINTAKPIQDIDKKKYSDFYFNGEWLKKNKMYMVKGMHYIHRIRKNSAWLEYKHTIQPVVHQVKAELMGEKQCECKHCRRKRNE